MSVLNGNETVNYFIISSTSQGFFQWTVVTAMIQMTLNLRYFLRHQARLEKTQHFLLVKLQKLFSSENGQIDHTFQKMPCLYIE